MGGTVLDDERLWRRVHRLKIKPDGKPASDTFKTVHLSVHRRALTTLDEVLRLAPDHCVFEFTAGEAQSLDLEVVEDPPPPDHALVLGTTVGNRARRLRSLARPVG